MVSIKELKENPKEALRKLHETAIIPNDVLRFAILQNKRHRTIQNKPLLFKYVYFIISLEKVAPKNEVQQLIYPSVTIDEIYNVERKYLTFAQN